MSKKKKIRRRRKLCFRFIISVTLCIIGINLLFRWCSSVSSNCINGIVLINKEHVISKNYEPNNLVVPNVAIANEACEEERHVDESIVEDLQQLFNGALNDGYKLYLLSGFRSYSTQESIYERNVESNGKEHADLFVAKPGKSEHQSGLAVDITNESRCFSGSEEANWIANNAYKYGFVVRYDKNKEDITGYSYEPWHIRYVGKKIASELFSKGLSLEEYLLE